MISNWMNEFDSCETNDPGKDIFSVMLCSMVLVFSICILFMASSGSERVASNTTSNGAKVIDQALLATLETVGDAIYIRQNGKQYTVPKDASFLKQHGLFDVRHREDGKDDNVLLIEDPGEGITAGRLILVISCLNEVGISVEFPKTIQK